MRSPSSTSRSSSSAATRSSTITSARPTIAPILGALVCVVLIVDNEGEIFLRAGLLLLLGAVLWVLTYAGGHRSANGGEPRPSAE